MNLDPLMLKNACLCALAVYGIMEAIKPFVWKWSSESWQRTLVRLVSLIVGAGFGALLQMGAEGALVGLAGAAMSSTLVSLIKRKVDDQK